MKTALVTGANKSIGFEVTKQLTQKGIYVYLGCRNLENGIEAVNKLKGEGIHHVEAIQLDVTNDESVKEARIIIGEQTKSLDILINNAGIYGGYPQSAF
ncbi:SDR family NAD(P)-dependent oxidoreductase, partial [Fluviicola sp.]|uniref:SDR family NAD(P)-dependent oxidoreductase n=1 Tax=Fluviicola sp. TaxID=1917219 RepID=UPI00262571EF